MEGRPITETDWEFLRSTVSSLSNEVHQVNFESTEETAPSVKEVDSENASALEQIKNGEVHHEEAVDNNSSLELADAQDDSDVASSSLPTYNKEQQTDTS